jgi:hypothetical protein
MAIAAGRTGLPGHPLLRSDRGSTPVEDRAIVVRSAGENGWRRYGR